MSHRSVIKGATTILVSLSFAGAEPVVDWVTTNGDAGFAPGTAATNSPVTTDSDAETIVGSFSETTLQVGQTLTLTGTINITGQTGVIPGNQIRWALFEAPGTPTTGVGDGYVGIWATTANLGACTIRNANGSTTNPFSGSATEIIVTENGLASIVYRTSYDFALAVTRSSETEISVTGSLTETESGLELVSWPETVTAPFPDTFTYNCVGILLGGTTNATQAAFTNVEVNLTPLTEEELVITSISGNPVDGSLSISWTSTPDRVYAVDGSGDLQDWSQEIDDNVIASETGNETTFPIPPGSLAGNERLFFRVRDITP